jgi:hypothetical protein
VDEDGVFSGEFLRCGGDGQTQALLNTTTGERVSCGVGYKCSHPGTRHGHKTIKISVEGQAEALLMFGGEITDFASTSARLTNEVHIGMFSATAVTFTRLPTSGGTRQVPNVDASKVYPDNYWASPAPRRDAALAIMGNEGSENGRLLVFGGLANVLTSSKSPVKDYLEGADYGVTAFNDLWYVNVCVCVCV